MLARSAELRCFLTTRDDLQPSAAWRALSGPHATVLTGTTKLFKQMVGRENVFPPAEEAATPTGESRDLVRQLRERVYHIRHRKCALRMLIGDSANGAKASCVSPCSVQWCVAKGCSRTVVGRKRLGSLRRNFSFCPSGASRSLPVQRTARLQALPTLPALLHNWQCCLRASGHNTNVCHLFCFAERYEIGQHLGVLPVLSSSLAVLL